MKHSYDHETGAFISLSEWGARKWYIASCHTPREHRNQGIATNLLRQITQDADDEMVILCLDVVPCDADVDEQRLPTLYQRFGFRSGGQGAFMFRFPTGMPSDIGYKSFAGTPIESLAGGTR